MTLKDCSKEAREVWSEFKKRGGASVASDIDGFVGGVKYFGYIPGRSLTIYGGSGACGIPLNGEESTGTFRNFMYAMRQFRKQNNGPDGNWKKYWM